MSLEPRSSGRFRRGARPSGDSKHCAGVPYHHRRPEQRSRGLETDKGSLIRRAGNYVPHPCPPLHPRPWHCTEHDLSMYIYRLNFKTPRSSLKNIQSSTTDNIFTGHILSRRSHGTSFSFIPINIERRIFT